MNGKVVYETPLGDRFLFFQEDRFTVVRNDTAESHGYQINFSGNLKSPLTPRRPICCARQLGMFTVSQGRVSDVNQKRWKKYSPRN